MSVNRGFSYIKSLDGVRAFALLLVLIFHGTYGIIKGGWIGVDLFFTLSGYLITSLLLHEYARKSTINLKNFYIRRILRLLPPLIICIILANIFWQTKESQSTRYIASFASLFYMANLFGKYMGNLNHVWSLSVEEHFYLIWPIFTSFFLFRMNFSSKLIYLTLIIILSSAIRIYLFNSPPVKIGPLTIDYYTFTLCRIDSIIYGVVLAIALFDNKIQHKYQNERHKYKIGVIIFLMFTLISLLLNFNNSVFNNGAFIITNLLCSFTILFAVTYQENIFLNNRIFGWLGQRSYGIYVYHLPIFLAMEKFRHQGSLSNFLLILTLRFAATFIIAEASFRYIEQPIQRLRKNFVS